MNTFRWVQQASFLLMLICAAWPIPAFSQDSDETTGAKLILETRTPPPKPEPLYTAQVKSQSEFGENSAKHAFEVRIVSVRGKTESASLEIRGAGEILNVTGAAVQAWSVRRTGEERFLDVTFIDEIKNVDFQVAATTPVVLPDSISLLHLSTGKAIGFSNSLKIRFSPSVAGKIVEANGFTKAAGQSDSFELQTVSGGDIQLTLKRSSGARPDVELTQANLTGKVHPSGKSVDFRYQAKVTVTRPGELRWLVGALALNELPKSSNYRLVLSHANAEPQYKLVFDEVGEFDIEIDFVAKVMQRDGRKSFAFYIATGAIVPLELNGLADNIDFLRASDHIVPTREQDVWKGFLPADGVTRLSWKEQRKTADGKLFFETSGRTETRVSAGLLKQSHYIDYKILQGEVNSLQIEVRGPGEILNVQGAGIVGWTSKDDAAVDGSPRRMLTLEFAQPVSESFSLLVGTQSAIGTFPVQVETITLHPLGAIRHSGHIRISNSGAVRIEPVELQGVTQLSPGQFPGQQIQGRQVFVYRFPSSEHGVSIAADQIQPEVSVSQLVLYALSETERTITADVELDIREAPIREFEIELPQEYSVVAVAGASVADYLVASEPTDGRRTLKVIFSGDVGGRQLVSITLEEGVAAEASDWILPKLTYPTAKSVAGNIGIVSAPGFRIEESSSYMLVEKPLSYFPKPVKNLQQAYRIRERDWTGTMKIEVLQRSIQADVFHLYSLSQGVVYGSSLINYFITGSPVAELTVAVPDDLGNVMLDGQDVRTWRRDGENLIVSLHQPVLGPYTLLVTFEQESVDGLGIVRAGEVTPVGVASEQGYIQVVSPMQVDVETAVATEDLLVLDPLELPAEFRLLSTAPALGTWQYTNRPFTLDLKINWFQPGALVGQIVEYSEAKSRVSADGELVTDVVYYVKSRGQRTLRVQLPDAPVKLWAVSVDGRPVTARQAGPETLIPLPGVDPNVPVEVALRLGKPAVSESEPQLSLPILSVPVLKTQWEVVGDEQRALVPVGGTVAPPEPVVASSGLVWLATLDGSLLLAFVAALLVAGSLLTRGGFARTLQLFCWIGAAIVAFVAANVALETQEGRPPLRLNVPVLAAGEGVELQVANLPDWQVGLSWPGVIAAIIGAGLLLASCLSKFAPQAKTMRFIGLLALGVGLLLQSGGASYFFYALGVALLLVLILPRCVQLAKDFSRYLVQSRAEAAAKEAASSDSGTDPETGTGGVATTIVCLLASALSLGVADPAWAQNTQTAQIPAPAQNSQPSSDTADIYSAASSIEQEWKVSSKQKRLNVSGSVQIIGKPGDQFVLLYAPAVLTHFEGEGLRISKGKSAGRNAYLITIPRGEDSGEDSGDEANDQDAISDDDDEPTTTALGASQSDTRQMEFEATFEYLLESINVQSLPVLTGPAAVQQFAVELDQTGWELTSQAAVRIESLDHEPAAAGAAQVDATAETSRWNVLLSAAGGSLEFRPRARDIASEETRFFVEGNNLFIPGPGVVDGYHRLSIRPSQGQVQELSIEVPLGLTVSSVDGPISSWQFDADNGKLMLQLEPAQSVAFEILVTTQRGLDTLPTEVELAPLTVSESGGEVGVLALAFGSDAQPEKATTETLSSVSLTDFDSRMLPESKPTLFRVYRYGKSGGNLLLRVAPVEPEVRVISKQVLSLGDERVVLAANFVAEITRAGLFQLSFPLPEGMEVESLTGDALDHWSELEEGGQRIIVMHLGGKTIGSQQFALSLSAATSAIDASTSENGWEIPRFVIREAKRQTGELAVRPTTGIRLRTIARQNASEIDPREMGGSRAGSLAFRLLQKDWAISLGIEQLQPWITGGVLHDVTVREGQTRCRVIGDFSVQNASIRSMRIRLPFTDEDQAKTLRATGETVSDFVRTAPDSDVWELRFKRRIVGKFRFQLEYERRGERENETETLNPLEFVDVRQIAYYYAIRAGGRLELKHGGLSQGWQEADWNTVPPVLRDASSRTSPAIALRAVSPPDPLRVTATRHSLAESLKLRVASGQLTTILSPTGDQLTSVDVEMEVVQRSSLSVQLPDGGELFSIFVNGESVHSIRNAAENDAWQFYILPGIDDRTATVRFVYSVKGESLTNLRLTGPLLNVPLENIRWNVIAPRGFELLSNDGNLELVTVDRLASDAEYDRESYLSQVSGKRQVQKQQATKLLEQANQLLQEGQQTKARRALNSVANQYGLDAASNEDARVQLENLQTQQAIVGLNTRRQRLFLSNSLADVSQVENEQMMQAAAGNPILQQEQLNFRPQQLSQLLRGNTSEDNAVLQRIAGRLVQHQRSTEPAPQAIIISLPEEGGLYEFSRTVQVSEKAPLELELSLASEHDLPQWRAALAVALLLCVAVAFAFHRRDDQGETSAPAATT